MKSVFANDRLRLAITDTCNYCCPYCTNEGQRHNAGHYLPVEFVENLANKVQSEGIHIRKLNITGGEPLLHPKHVDIVALCTHMSESVTLNTNGALLSKPLIDALCASGLHNIKFGMDSFFQRSSKPGALETTSGENRSVDNLLYAISLMPRSSANIVVTDFNSEEMDRTLDFVCRRRIDKAEFLELIRFDFRRSGSWRSSGPRISELVDRYAARFREVSYNPDLAKYICLTHDDLMIQFAEDFCLRRVCQNLWTRIDATGQFVSCIKSAHGAQLDFRRSLVEQIRRCNALMCNGRAGHLPRDYSGRLLPNGQIGHHEKPDHVLRGERPLTETQLDP
jgi:molybdenum cofactor biosynthesis enzyme MoaA